MKKEKREVRSVSDIPRVTVVGKRQIRNKIIKNEKEIRSKIVKTTETQNQSIIGGGGNSELGDSSKGLSKQLGTRALANQRAQQRGTPHSDLGKKCSTKNHLEQ